MDADGRSALWAAARAGDAVSVRLCLAHGGDTALMDARRDAFSAGAGVANCTPLFAAVWREEFDAVRELLRRRRRSVPRRLRGRTPISLVNRGSDAHTENTRRIREILDRYLDAAEAKPEMLDAARASYERRAASQRRQAERFAARARRAAEDAAEDAARREASLVALNTELDALKVASEAARAAQQASALAEMPRKNVKGAAANAAARLPTPTAGEVAALVAAADERREAVRSALDALKRDVITADDLAADGVRRSVRLSVRKSVTARLSFAAGKRAEAVSTEEQLADLWNGGDGRRVRRSSTFAAADGIRERGNAQLARIDSVATLEVLGSE